MYAIRSYYDYFSTGKNNWKVFASNNLYAILTKRWVSIMQKSRLRAAILNAANRNAALVIKNAKIVNVFTEEIIEGRNNFV